MISSVIRACCLVATIAAAVSFTLAEPPAASSPASQKAVSAERINELVKQLGAEDFKAREAAQKELLQIGAPAKAAIEEAAKLDDLEVKQRTSVLLAEIAQQEAAAVSREMAKRLAWSTELDELTGSPVMCGKAILALTGDGIVAVSAETGKKLWNSDLKEPFLLTTCGGMAVAANKDKVLGVEVKTGKAMWEYDKFGDDEPPTQLVADDTTVYVADSASKLTAISGADGKEQWKVDCLNTIKPLMLSGKTLVMAGLEGKVAGAARMNIDTVLAAYNLENGKQLWKNMSPVPLASVAVGKDVAYVLKQTEMSAVKLEDGKEAWKAKLPETVNIYYMRINMNGRAVTAQSNPSPVVGKDSVYVLLQQSMVGFDLKSGQQSVSHQLEAASGGNLETSARMMRGGMVVINGRVKMGMSGGGQLLVDEKSAYVQRGDRLQALDLKDGKSLWSLNVGGQLTGKGVLEGGILYFMTQPDDMGVAVDPATGAEAKPKNAIGLNLKNGIHALKVRPD